MSLSVVLACTLYIGSRLVLLIPHMGDLAYRWLIGLHICRRLGSRRVNIYVNLPAGIAGDYSPASSVLAPRLATLA
jgi:hypothetical protein